MVAPPGAAYGAPVVGLRARTARLALAVAALGLPLLVASPAAAINLPAGFADTPIATGLTAPTAVAWSPDGRMFVAEKRGRVRVVTADGTLLPQPLIDISGHVNAFHDRGLLGIATDSSFATNGFLYLFYVYEHNRLQPSGSKVSRVTRVTVNPDNTVARPTSPETVVLGRATQPPCGSGADCIPADSCCHAIGGIRSAPDGTLWIGTGDAASPGGVDERAFRTYDENNLAGKLIHVDRSGRGLSDHPFCRSSLTLDAACAKVYAKGFRYAYKFALRDGAGPIVGDVGWNTREEIDLVQPGRNYGWPCYEGAVRTPGYSGHAKCAAEYRKEGTSSAAAGPAYDYPRPNQYAAIVQGPRYTEGDYPAEYEGRWFYGDASAGFVRSYRIDGSAIVDVQPFATGVPQGVHLDRAPDGDLVYVSYGSGNAGQGSVRRISYDGGGNRPPVARATADPTLGAAPLAVQLTGSGSEDPDGDALAYEWDFGDEGGSTAADPSHVFTADGVYEATLTVRDGKGGSDTDSVTVTVGDNRPPTATISAPADGATFRAGTTVALRGAGQDPEDGALPDSGLTWHVILHHGNHIHDLGHPTGSQASFPAASDHDADVSYEIVLTATDSAGATDTATARIRPQTVALTLDSSPRGAPLGYGGDAVVAPFTKQAAVGFRTTLSAADSFVVGGTAYRFYRWSDGGARQHAITIPTSALRLTATYKAGTPWSGGGPAGR